MNRRLELHEILCDILGSRNVYFQPPESVKMNYPAIVYALKNITNKSADNTAYIQSYSYELTVIDKNPDCEFVNDVLKLPTCSFDRHFKSDNLNHYTFTLFY